MFAKSGGEGKGGKKDKGTGKGGKGRKEKQEKKARGKQLGGTARGPQPVAPSRHLRRTGKPKDVRYPDQL